MRRTPLTTTPRRQRQSCVRIMMLLIRATAAGGYIASVRRDRRSANRIAAAPGLARPGPRSQAACPDHSCVILSNPEGRQAGRRRSTIGPKCDRCNRSLCGRRGTLQLHVRYDIVLRCVLTLRAAAARGETIFLRSLLTNCVGAHFKDSRAASDVRVRPANARLARAPAVSPASPSETAAAAARPSTGMPRRSPDRRL